MGFDVLGPVILSLQVSCSAVLVLVLPSFVLASATQRDGWIPALLDGALQVPLVLPPVVVGYGLLWALGPASFPGEMFQRFFGVSFAFSFWAAVLSGVIVGMPFFVKSMQQSLQAVPEEALLGVYGLGLHPRVARLLTRVLYAIGGCGRGALLAFSRSFGEFGATIIFASNIPDETRTVPLAIYTLSESLDTSGAAEWLCAISVAIAFLAVILVRLGERSANNSRSAGKVPCRTPC